MQKGFNIPDGIGIRKPQKMKGHNEFLGKTNSLSFYQSHNKTPVYMAPTGKHVIDKKFVNLFDPQEELFAEHD